MGLGKSLKKAARKISKPVEKAFKNSVTGPILSGALGGLAGLATYSSYQQNKVAKAQSQAAASYAAAQEQAAAVQAAAAGTTAVVAKQEDNAAAVAEANVHAANKRRKTVSSTAPHTFSGRVNSLLGLTGGRASL